MTDRAFLPGLRFRALTPVYDLACRFLGLGDRFRKFEVALLPVELLVHPAAIYFLWKGRLPRGNGGAAAIP